VDSLPENEREFIKQQNSEEKSRHQLQLMTTQQRYRTESDESAAQV